MGIWSIIALVLFAAGFIFVGIELFLPGFGWPGVSGIICFAAGIFLTAESFEQGMLITLAVIAVLGILFWIVMHRLAKGKFRSPLILKDEMVEKGGFVSANGLDGMVGAVGTAVTDLRPTGTGSFDGKELDVVSTGKYIPKGTEIVICRAEGYHLVVREKGDE